MGAAYLGFLKTFPEEVHPVENGHPRARRETVVGASRAVEHGPFDFRCSHQRSVVTRPRLDDEAEPVRQCPPHPECGVPLPRGTTRIRYRRIQMPPEPQLEHQAAPRGGARARVGRRRARRRGRGSPRGGTARGPGRPGRASTPRSSSFSSSRNHRPIGTPKPILRAGPDRPAAAGRRTPA